MGSNIVEFKSKKLNKLLALGSINWKKYSYGNYLVIRKGGWILDAEGSMMSPAGKNQRIVPWDGNEESLLASALYWIRNE